jgi:hypothetical protein
MRSAVRRQWTDHYVLGTPEERFWSKVNKLGSWPENRWLGRCWEWTASTNPKGYGQFQTGTGCVLAHRFSWKLKHGSLPKWPKCLMHRCDNSACVRPSHLKVGTRADNNADMDRKGRRGLGGFAIPKLTDEQVAYIRSQRGIQPQQSLADEFGVRREWIGRIQLGKSRVR